MLYFRRSPLMRAVVVPTTMLSFLSALSACQKWAPVEDPVVQTLAAEQPSKVRVTTSAQQVVVLEDPEVREESLIGVAPNSQSMSRTFETELSGIRSIEVWRVPPDVPRAQWLETPIPIERLCADQVDRIRLTLGDGRQVALNDPRVEENRVIGETDPDYVPQTTFPLNSLVKVEQREANTALTTVAILGGVLVVGLLVAASSIDLSTGN